MNLTCMEVEHSSANNTSEGRKCVSFATLSHLALNPELTDKYLMGFLGSSADKESACNAGDPGSIPGLAKIPWRRDRLPTPVFLGFSGSSVSKESTCNEGDLGSIPGLGRSPGGASHSSILDWIIPMDRGAWRAAVHEVTKSQT